MKRLIGMTEPELRSYFNHLGSLIQDVMPAEVRPGSGHKGQAMFALLVFDDPGVSQYLSTARRADMIKALREAADRLERNEDLRR